MVSVGLLGVRQNPRRGLQPSRLPGRVAARPEPAAGEPFCQTTYNSGTQVCSSLKWKVKSS